MMPIEALPMLDIDLSKVFNYCIVRFASLMKLSLGNAAQELVYDWYHRTGDLTESLHDFLSMLVENEKCWECLSDEDNHGFDAFGEFDPYNMDELKDAIIANAMQDLAIEYASIRKAEKLFKIEHRNVDMIVNNQALIENGDPWGKVPSSVFWMLVKNEITLEAFKMYVAIASIIGNKPFGKTYKKVIAMRMAGQTGKADEMASRRQIDNHIRELSDLDLVRVLPGGRCWYVSTRLDMAELKVEVNKLMKKRKLNELKQQHRAMDVIEN